MTIKTILPLLLSCIAFTSCDIFGSGDLFDGGRGTAENPYQISSLEQLQKIADVENLDKHFIQVSDIDASASEELQNGSGFKFIGSAKHPFTGSYDGNGFSIRNLKINFNKFDPHNGMFGYVKDGLLENITIDNSEWLNNFDIDSFASSKQNNQSHGETSELQNIDIEDMDGVGGIAGMNDGGRIINCHFIGSITFYGQKAGLVGVNTGTIEDSSFEGRLSVAASGLVTENYGTILRSGVKVRNTSQVASGFVRNNVGEIIESYADIDLGGSNAAAGFVMNNEGVIRSSFVRGMLIEGNRNSSGFVSDNRGLIEDAYIIGVLQIEIYDDDHPDITSEFGGFVGNNYSNGVIRNAFIAGTIIVDGNMEELSLFGAFAGENSGMIDHGYWDEESTGMDTGVDEGDTEGTTGLTTAQMTGPAAEQNMPEFDWVNIWRTTEDGYPVLRWEEE